MDKKLIIEEFPLFVSLSPEEKEMIFQKANLLEYRKGSCIYREGSAPSALYCLVSGRVKIYTLDQYGGPVILEYLHHGKYFGIISLLTDEPHSVSAEAMNDCFVLEIKKDDFNFILNKIPTLAIDLSQTLSRRLKRKDVHQKTIFESTVVSVFSSYSHAGKTVYALNLALSLKKETRKKVIILDVAPCDKAHSLPHKLSIPDFKIMDLSGAEDARAIKNFIINGEFGVDLACFHYRPEDDSCVHKLVAVLSLLVNDYHYIVLDLPSLMDRIIFSMLNQSDLIQILSSPESVDLQRTRHLISRLKSEFNFQEEKIAVVINEYKYSKLSHEEQEAALGYPVFATLPKIDFESAERLVLDEPDCEYAKAVRRVARQIGDCLVGLVLGVGVAYGFCHLGVLKVIEEENIPIDIIVGSSIGALIASLWATGMSSRQILDIFKEFKEPKHIWGLVDLTFPVFGFIKGNKLRRFFKKCLGDKTFQDTRLPLKIIASDVKRKEPKIFDKGPLVDAIMASCSMPGVFAPFRFKEGMLFDGGVTNPLPTEPLLKMGVKKIIAINVTPSREDILRQYEKFKEQITVTLPQDLKKRRWFDLKEHFRGIFGTNILEIIFSSVEILQSEVAQKEAQLADVVLHPDTQGLFWLELHKAEEFARRGELEARKNLDKILQLVKD
jgi:NTE family protein